MYDIINDWTALLRQAVTTAGYYLLGAIDSIDGHFGKGYAAKHPELVIAFMDICERDFANSSNTVIERAKIEMRELGLE